MWLLYYRSCITESKDYIFVISIQNYSVAFRKFISPFSLSRTQILKKREGGGSEAEKADATPVFWLTIASQDSVSLVSSGPTKQSSPCYKSNGTEMWVYAVFILAELNRESYCLWFAERTFV